jgi:hypothetical protein
MNAFACRRVASVVAAVAVSWMPATAQLITGENTAQFLSLPMHPRPQADGNGTDDNYNANGIYRRGSHFIWQAPLANGQPPGQTFDNAASGPAASVDAAPSSGLFISGLSPVAVSTSATGPYHGETGATSIPGLLVAGSNRIYPGSCASNPCGVVAYESTDAGGTWTETGLATSWNGATFGITFDPALAADADGNVYYVLGGAPLSGNYPNSIAVAKRSAATGTWSTPVAVTFNSNKYFDDKYWIAVDRSLSPYRGRIYVVWDRNTSTNQILYLSSSNNGGATWTAPIKIDDGKSKFERVIGAYATVDATGGVYVSWHNYAKGIIYVDRSINGGLSWGGDVAAATTNTGFGMDIGCNGGRKQSPAHHLIADATGTLHLVYANNVAGRGYDIFYKQSTTHGATWTAPVRLNDDAGAGHQYHPTLSVDGSQVTVSFYDRRDDAANCLTHVYSTRSITGGATWSANARVTDAASNFNGNSNGPGDYSSSTPSLAGDWSFFSDHTTSTFQILGSSLP